MNIDKLLSTTLTPPVSEEVIKGDPKKVIQEENFVSSKGSNSSSMMSGLFVDQQTDHSQYVRANLKSVEGLQNAMTDKMSAMTSLLQAQINYEESMVPENNACGQLDLSYSRRARIGRRAARMILAEFSELLTKRSEAADKASNSSSEHVDAKSDGAVALDKKPVRSMTKAKVVAPQPRPISIRV